MSSSEPNKARIFFLPLMADGHLIPMANMARLFARRGVCSTFVTTRANASVVSSTMDRAASQGHSITLLLVSFPSAEAGLPEGCENLGNLTSTEMLAGFSKAVTMLYKPIKLLLEEHKPDCLVSDAFLPSTGDIARELGIRRIVFNGTGFFPHCVTEIMQQQGPVPEEVKSIMVPSIPHRVEMLRSQLPDYLREPNDFGEKIKRMTEIEIGSYGMVVNSFYELESEYVEHYTKVFGRKAWHVGPVSFPENDSNGEESLAWLDGKKPNSVIYVCFGSWSLLTAAQKREIAFGLEDSGQQFVWATREDEKTSSEWTPEGFAEEKGMLIRDWVPQVAILNHEAVGGFLTHCGWNSVLEAVSSGVPSGEQRFVIDVARTGVEAGARTWGLKEDEKEVIGREQIAAAVRRVMDGGDEGCERRERARRLKEMAKRAVEDGGSSYEDIGRLINEISDLKARFSEPEISHDDEISEQARVGPVVYSRV